MASALTDGSHLGACEELGIKPKITIIVVGKRHHVRFALYPLSHLALSYVRHLFRFFPRTEAGTDKSGNCKAGTVVDTEVAHPTEFDFYLQSHGGLLGTSRPAHYSVRPLYVVGYVSDGWLFSIGPVRCKFSSDIIDTAFLTPSVGKQLFVKYSFSPVRTSTHTYDISSADALQSLSFALCHVYARSTRSVSIPAPVYCKYLTVTIPSSCDVAFLLKMLISSAPARKITMTPLASTFRILPRRPMPAKLIRLSKSLKTPSSLCTKFRPLSCTSRCVFQCVP